MILYIDVGAGSLVAQVSIAAILGVLSTARTARRRIVTWWRALTRHRDR